MKQGTWYQYGLCHADREEKSNHTLTRDVLTENGSPPCQFRKAVTGDASSSSGPAHKTTLWPVNTIIVLSVISPLTTFADLSINDNITVKATTVEHCLPRAVLSDNHSFRELTASWHDSAFGEQGITLDRALTFKWNCVSLKQKVSSRNNLLRKLTSTKWGASPDVLRTTGLALCYSAGEFACPVWARSAHCREVDVALNDTCRTITGCLKPTPVWMLYSLCGIAPPDVRREAACSREKHRQETDPRHPLYNQEPAPYRLKSRKSFLRSTVASHKDPSKERIDLWQAKYPMANSFIPPNESLPPGHELPWATWKSLNRLRTNMGRCGENMCRWGYRGPASNICACGASPQTMEHLMVCPGCPNTCTREDLLKANQRGIDVAAHWAAEFNGMSWGLPALVCDCYIAMDVTCSTSSIFNLVAISVDRFIAVTQPIKYAKHKSKGRVWSMIVVAWLVSGAIGSPIALGLNYTPDRVPDQCLFNSRDYVIFSSLGSFYIPCVIMCALYFRIFTIGALFILCISAKGEQRHMCNTQVCLRICTCTMQHCTVRFDPVLTACGMRVLNWNTIQYFPDNA
ncbi:unnamed protein product [Plutella xylostella]|uniref:(diamondback moth) hypothetical protein n=1 Tax=Plutella xylostella TaxID=51655 RepID=A0A8S4G6N8_PLUXY|nr:unnamed protein product [Plutella xylostella]